MENTTVPTKPGVFSEISKRLQVNLQTYALVIALVVIWGTLFYPDERTLSIPAKFLEPVPADDRNSSVIGWHGPCHRDR